MVRAVARSTPPCWTVSAPTRMSDSVVGEPGGGDVTAADALTLACVALGRLALRAPGSATPSAEVASADGSTVGVSDMVGLSDMAPVAGRPTGDGPTAYRHTVAVARVRHPAPVECARAARRT